MKYEKVCLSLHFVTGSAVCTGQKIQVRFNKLGGMARHLTSHTCSVYWNFPPIMLALKILSEQEKMTVILNANQKHPSVKSIRPIRSSSLNGYKIW